MKRAVDLAVAFLGLLFFLPLLVLIAIVIKLTSPGPVFFVQARVGQRGRFFRIYKFRTMTPDAENRGSSVTTSRDPRITRAGRFLRRTNLDELPQLWNVLIGDMSLVGPRPDTPEIVASYTAEMRRILEVPQGMTSIASLHLLHEGELLALSSDPDVAYARIVVPAKVQLAMEHWRRNSLRFDLAVLVKTIWALSGGRLLPMKEHPVVREIRLGIAQMARACGE
jgi:lipopolysaccharide/colanic/teichoic acid biosynthesis glycosyltransferase